MKTKSKLRMFLIGAFAAGFLSLTTSCSEQITEPSPMRIEHDLHRWYTDCFDYREEFKRNVANPMPSNNLTDEQLAALPNYVYPLGIPVYMEIWNETNFEEATGTATFAIPNENGGLNISVGSHANFFEHDIAQKADSSGIWVDQVSHLAPHEHMIHFAPSDKPEFLDSIGHLVADTNVGTKAVLNNRTILDLVPEEKRGPIPWGSPVPGPGYVFVAVQGSTPRLFSVEIGEVFTHPHGFDAFSFLVTDPELIQKIEGQLLLINMSGSPIKQRGENGGLEFVGAFREFYTQMLPGNNPGNFATTAAELIHRQRQEIINN